MDIKDISKKQIIYTMLGLFLFLAIIGGLIEEAENQAKDTVTITPTVTPTRIPMPTESKYAPYFRHEYISSCNVNGASIRYCICTYDYIEEQYGSDRLIEFADEYGLTGELPEELFDAVYECQKYLAK